MPVHHGLATMAGLGLIGVMLFGRFGRRDLDAMKGKGRGEWSGGVLTEVEIGRLDIGVRPTVKRSKRQRWRSVMGGFGAWGGGEKGSMRCGEA
jgi:hypothetical protein